MVGLCFVYICKKASDSCSTKQRPESLKKGKATYTKFRTLIYYDDWTRLSRPLFNSFAISRSLLSKDDKEKDDILNMLEIKWTPSLMLPVAPRPRLMKLPPQLDCLFSWILQIKFFLNLDSRRDTDWFRPLFPSDVAFQRKIQTNFLKRHGLKKGLGGGRRDRWLFSSLWTYSRRSHRRFQSYHLSIDMVGSAISLAYPSGDWVGKGSFTFTLWLLSAFAAATGGEGRVTSCYDQQY
jgi:hypothetical protein